jgi:hypothetical protein
MESKPILRKNFKELRRTLKEWWKSMEGNSWLYPYLEEFLNRGEDKSIKDGLIALEKPSSSLEEWLHWSMRGMWPL